MKRYLGTRVFFGGAVVVAVAACTFIVGSSVAVAAGQQAPAAPRAQQPGAAQGAGGAGGAGQRVFVTNCGFCHGPDAHGGQEGGPDLTRSTIALSGTQLPAFLKVGRPPKMPSFDLPDADVASIVAFVTSQAPATNRNAAGDPNVVLVGNAEAGKAYFNGAGKCTTCHSVTGDLQHIGSKYNPQLLQGRMLLARGTGGYPGLSFGPPRGTRVVDLPRKVEVKPAKGPTVSGDLVRVSDYLVVVKDSAGVLHTFTRDGAEPNVTITDPLQGHIDMLPKWTSRDMHDVTAYLVTLK